MAFKKATICNHKYLQITFLTISWSNLLGYNGTYAVLTELKNIVYAVFFMQFD